MPRKKPTIPQLRKMCEKALARREEALAVYNTLLDHPQIKELAISTEAQVDLLKSVIEACQGDTMFLRLMGE